MHRLALKQKPQSIGELNFSPKSRPGFDEALKYRRSDDVSRRDGQTARRLSLRGFFDKRIDFPDPIANRFPADDPVTAHFFFRDFFQTNYGGVEFPPRIDELLRRKNIPAENRMPN